MDARNLPAHGQAVAGVFGGHRGDVLGARPLARIIQDEVKAPLGEELLFGKLEKGGAVVVSTQESDIEDERTGEKKKGVKLKFDCTAAIPEAPQSRPAPKAKAKEPNETLN